MQPAVAPYTIPEEVARYCAATQLTPYLDTAIRLAEEAFSPVRRLQVSLEADPETGEDYLFITVAIDDRGEQVLEQKKRFTRAWVQSAPPEIRRKFSISYDFV
jgi:hypothetical protein